MGSHLLLDMSNIPTGVVPTDNLVDNGRKKILVIGKTGTGKSSLCNVLCGADHDADLFPVSAEAMSCTQRTFFCEAFFYNNKEEPFSLIDTIGFDDPDKDDDAKIIAELVLKLKNGCDFVNLFVIAVNGQNPRLDGSLLGMIKIFEGMFGQDFWKQVVVLFTRMPMDEKAKKKREKNSKQSDDELAQKYMAEVAKRFKHGKQIDYVFLDSCFDKEDPEEKRCFDQAMDKLLNALNAAKPLPTSKVQEVATEKAALRREIAEKESAAKATQERLIQLAKEQEEDAKKLADQEKQLHQANLNAEKEKAKILEKDKEIEQAKLAGEKEKAKVLEKDKEIEQAKLAGEKEKAKVLEKDKEIEQAKLAGEKEKAKSLEAEKNAQKIKAEAEEAKAKSLEAEKNAQNVKLEAEKAKAKALEAQLDQVRVKQEETIRNQGREISELNRQLQEGGRPKKPIKKGCTIQ